ncbi:UNC93-like protein [Anopheles aquasalis]|uniref:UNC93-like protein n=1 Tax=Anopheles aquasalis TaxID=42839 RepID=UPI00215B046D|nr:UNC93-like protein [Anopheles aquasalis]
MTTDLALASGDGEALAAIEKLGPREKWRIVKNIAVLGFAFMIHFTAFHGTSNLQSSLHNDGSLGAYTLASIYGSLIVSNLFLPVLVIRLFGCKWTIVVSFMAYIPYIAAQFYPSFATLIPSGLAVGFGGGPLWCAKCTYLSIIAEAFSIATRRTVRTEYLIVKFFSLFFVFYQLAQVLGNLISFTVLSYGEAGDGALLNGTERVETVMSQVNISATCGANYQAPVAGNGSQGVIDLKRPEESQLNTLTGIFLACMVAASISVAIGVDSLKRYNMIRTGHANQVSGTRMLIITLQQLGNKYQLLLLPITAFIGVEQAFIAVDFTKSFVACGLGISYIGYAMISFGLANAVAAACTPYITKHLGRRLLILVTALFHATLIVFMLLWRPTDEYYKYSIIVACWGLADGVWLIQINSLSGILFPGHEEEAFSNFRLWEATGSVIMYASSPFLSTFQKLLFVLGIMIVGTIGYGLIELMEYRVKRVIAEKRFEVVSQQADES